MIGVYERMCECACAEIDDSITYMVTSNMYEKKDLNASEWATYAICGHVFVATIQLCFFR